MFLIPTTTEFIKFGTHCVFNTVDTDLENIGIVPCDTHRIYLYTNELI